MGPLAMTGLSGFGAAIAIGLIAAASWPADEPAGGHQAASARGLAVILMAFCLGIAVLGTVVGLLAIFVAGAVTDTADGLFAAGPAVVGALIGLALIARHWRVADRGTAAFAAVYVFAIANLGCVVALLGVFVVEPAAKSLADWPFVILGFVSGATALAFGATGATAVRSMQGADESAAKAIVAAQISRSALLQIVFTTAGVVAVLLIVLS
jgi:hypothetical protein